MGPLPTPAEAEARIRDRVRALPVESRPLASLAGAPVRRRDDPEASARGIAYLAAGRPARWHVGAAEDIFEPQSDESLRGRYRRWRALMAEATGV